jgi:glutathione peroxidase
MGSYLAKHKEESIKAPVLSFWELAARDIDQNLINFDQFKGKKAILIVNVASNSKFTESNYKQLSQMREELKEKGLEVLAFPCNQFEKAEEGSNADIKKFVQENFDAKFPLFEKSLVNTEDLHPVYAYLRENSSLYDAKSDEVRTIEDNFSIFVVNSEGKVVKFFTPSEDLTPVRNFVEKMLI